MSEPINHEIAERLERLEAANRFLQSECRRWHRTGLAMAAVGVILGITGATAANRVSPLLEAHEFVLRDHDGKSRAALTIRDDGSPGLAFFDREGKVRLSFDLGKDKTANPTAPQETPGMNIYDQDGGLRAALTIRPDGTPGLGLFDKDRQPRLSLDLCADGSAGLNLYGHAATLRAALAVRPDGVPGLGLFNEQGQVVQSIDLAAPIRAAAH
jgi:hypothetical protein